MEKDELQQAEDSKTKGNECFKEKHFKKAERYYERGIGYINEFQSGKSYNFLIIFLICLQKMRSLMYQRSYGSS